MVGICVLVCVIMLEEVVLVEVVGVDVVVV